MMDEQLGKFSDEQLEQAAQHLELTGLNPDRLSKLKEELERRETQKEEEVPAEWFGLAERPPGDAPGWEDGTRQQTWGLMRVHQWRNPKTGEVEWIDAPPQMTADKDWYFIGAGAQDVTAPIWNLLWINGDRVNEIRGPKGLARIRGYKGRSTRTPPSAWFPKFRDEFLKGHPKWRVNSTGEPVIERPWLPYWGLGHDEYWRQHWLVKKEEPKSAGNPPPGFEEFKRKHPK
jgi:hypothetical protein